MASPGLAPSPMPGSPAQAAGLPAFGGGSSAGPGATPTSNIDPSVRLALQQATVQATQANAKLNDVLQIVQGLVTQFSPAGEDAKDIADSIDQLQKKLTSFVMTIVKQAPQPPPQQGPVAMR